MQESNVALMVRPEEFADLDRACAVLAGAARAARRIVEDTADRERWGLGESTPGLVSARTVVDRFRQCGAEIAAALAEHDRIAGEIARALLLVRERMCAIDTETAAGLRDPEVPVRHSVSRSA